MKKIKLNENLGRKTSIDEYILDPTEKYVIDIEEEMEFQVATMMSSPLSTTLPRRPSRFFRLCWTM